MTVAIGLDIGSSAVRAAQVRIGRRGSSLELIGQVELPTGAVRDGEIAEPEAVVNALTRLWSTHKLKSRKVAVGLANQQVVVRRLDLPYMTEEELRVSLPMQVDGLIPIPVDQAVLDFCYLGEWVNDDDERLVRILLVAAQRTMIDELLAVVRRAKLQPVGIDLDAFAALRSLAPPSIFTDAAAELLIDVGGTVTDLVVHENGAPHFVRTVLFGGQSVTAALADRLDLDLEEAEQMKLRVSANYNQMFPAEAAAADIIRVKTRGLIDQVKGSIDYCAAQRDIPRIERVVLTGGASQWPGLAEDMATELGLDITTGSPLGALERSKSNVGDEKLSAVAPHLAVAVGLAMGSPS
jgi:type IV pilus assembly protein PilM